MILRIRNVVRERPVGIQIDRAADVSAERLQNIRGKKSCGAVAGILNDVKSGKRMLSVLCLYFIDDDLLHVITVEAHHVKINAAALALRQSGR